MYTLKYGIKKDPVRRWALPDRIFFGHGACHVLAGVFLRDRQKDGLYAEWIVPAVGFAGTHIYVTDGMVAFDYHGYCNRQRLLAHHAKGWSTLRPGWSCEVQPIDFDLLDTAELNQRKMLGPDQYLHDTIARAGAFIASKNHKTGLAGARNTL